MTVSISILLLIVVSTVFCVNSRVDTSYSTAASTNANATTATSCVRLL